MFSVPVLVLLLAAVLTTFGGRVENDPCERRTCKGGGTCYVRVLQDKLDFTCSCQSGKAGRHCEIDRPHNWLGRTCTNNSDCKIKIDGVKARDDNAAAQPICFKEKCLCPIGYWYSVGQRFCVKGCKFSERTANFSEYPASVLLGSNDYNVDTDDVEVCKQACASKPDCENIQILRSTCFMAKKSPGEPGVSFTSTSTIWNYYQRHCN